jgi:hypothetical protein
MIFIPPFAMLDSTLNSYRHLMLPHLLTHQVYSNHFKRVKGLGQYIILDNGAAEGVKVTGRQLVDTCYDYKVDELVLPDVMGSSDATYDVATDFLTDYRNRLPVSTRLGYVLQGRTVTEAVDTYHRVRGNTRLLAKINVWYLPRLLVTPENPDARIDVAEYILDLEGKLPKPIHFLGAAPTFISEIATVRDRHLRIRSMDTSAPFVYAFAGRFIAEEGVQRRDQEKYFTSLVDNTTRALAMRNCSVMEGWAGAQTPTSEV